MSLCLLSAPGLELYYYDGWLYCLLLAAVAQYSRWTLWCMTHSIEHYGACRGLFVCMYGWIVVCCSQLWHDSTQWTTDCLLYGSHVRGIYSLNEHNGTCRATPCCTNSGVGCTPDSVVFYFLGYRCDDHSSMCVPVAKQLVGAALAFSNAVYSRLRLIMCQGRSASDALFVVTLGLLAYLVR